MKQIVLRESLPIHGFAQDEFGAVVLKHGQYIAERVYLTDQAMNLVKRAIRWMKSPKALTDRPPRHVLYGITMLGRLHPKAFANLAAPIEHSETLSKAVQKAVKFGVEVVE